MSSRQSISGLQGKASLKRTNIGSSKSVQALMVRIDWTSAKVVRIEARKDFTMQAATVKVLRGSYDVLANVKVNVQSGQVIYFVQSDGFPNYYYVLLYSEQSNSFHCTCPAHKACSHQQHAMTFVGHRHAEQVEREAAKAAQEWLSDVAPITFTSERDRAWQAMSMAEREAYLTQQQAEREMFALCATPPVTPKMSAEEANDFFLSLGKAEDARRQAAQELQYQNLVA